MRRALPIVVLLIILVAIVVVIARSATPSIDLPTQVSTLGQATPIAVHVADKYGVRSASATVEQNGAGFPVWQMAQPSKAREATWNFTVGVKTTPQLKDGKAKLIIESTSNDLLRRSARIERDVTVVVRPPTVGVDSE